MARASMADVIKFLRVKISDPSDGDTVWSDDELQDYLDLYRAMIRRELLSPASDKLEYASEFQLLEGTYARDTDTDAAWDDDRTIIKLWDSSGDGTAITPDGWNLIDGIFEFDTAQSTSIYMDARAYRWHGAVAEAMEQLAMDPAKAIAWTRGGVNYTFHDLNQIASHHRSLLGAKTLRVNRKYRRT